MTLMTKAPPTHRRGIRKVSVDQGGNYWAATGCTYDQLKNLCLSFGPISVKQAAACAATSLLKLADVGGDQETGFEQAFSSLAYAYMKDKAPRLLDYVVGFQLVDRNEDNTKAVAVFGFKVGKQWLYAPVFFLNGDLKGHELLYIKNQDAFVPMKENWVNYIMSRKPHVLGEGSQKDVFQLGGLTPNIERLAFPPAHSKYGADLGIDVDEWARGFLPPMAAAATKSARFVWNTRQAGEKLDMGKLAMAGLAPAFVGNKDFETFLNEDWRLAKLAYDWTKRYPGVKRALDQFYGPDLFIRVATRHKEAQDKAAINIMPTRQKQAAAQAPRMPGISILPDTRVKQAAGDEKVKIITRDDVAKANVSELESTKPDPVTDDDKGHILEHGYLVKDERTGEETTKVYATTVRQTLSNPHESGLYEVLERPGNFEKMLVLTNPYTNAGKKGFCTVIRTGDGEKSWLNAHRTTIFAKKIELDEDYKKWFDGLGDKSSLEKGGVYVALNHSGQGTCPFTVRETYEDGRFKVDFSGYFDKPRASSLPRTLLDSDGGLNTGFDGEYISEYGALLVINKRKDCKLRATHGELHVPELDFKFLRLKAPPKPKKKDDEDSILGVPCCGDSSMQSGSDPKPITPGDLKDLQLLFTEKTARLKLLGDAHEVTISGEKTGSTRLSYGQALFNLIRVHGTTEATAAEMLKTAQIKGTSNHVAVTYRVKYADGYPGMEGPNAPAIPPPQYGTEPIGYNNVNAIYSQEENIPVPGMDSSRTDPRIYDPFLRITPDQSAMGMAQQAGQEGQKEVFDTAMISGMLKAVRQDTLVDRYLGDLMKAVDKLGRLLFMFYWHQEEFSERYGKSDLPELEDSLRNALEVLGDVVLFLKEKTIEPGLDDVQDPTIEDAARN